ncbi:MAG: NAD-dependent epimerase/dehydratase family protein [Thermoplasmata archaeon]|nr:NAD-dependent epimerase/dehydratase family protein [Thermoplasmata archaeon]
MPGRADGGPVVVTGGAGAIGSTLVRSLVHDGTPVRVLDNLSSGRKESLTAVLGTSGVTLRVADVRNLDEILPDFEGASAVWHLAANPDIRLGTENPSIDLERGTVATFRVLEAARRFDVGRVLFTSSSVIYGLPTTFPTPEEYGPLLPQSQYGASKLASEALLSAFAHSYGMQAYIFRLANVIGPGMTHGILVDLFDKLRKDPTRLPVLGDGRQAKSYLRVEDCVAAMRFVGKTASETVNVYNLGSPDQVSVREIAEIVVAAHGGRARIEYSGGTQGWTGDIPKQWLSVEKLRRLGWSSARTSREAVEMTVRELAGARVA